MEDETRYGAPALTVEDARALAARVAAVVNERDELRREIHDLRLILGELASLREFLDDDSAGADAVPATSNGHLAHAPTDVAGDTAPDPADDAHGEAPELELETPVVVMDARRQLYTGETADDHHSEHAAGDADAVPELNANSVDDDPAARDRDETAAERRGETDAGDAAAASEADTPPADDAEPGPDTTAVVEAAERHDEWEACAANAPYNPPSQNETPADERPGDPDTAASHTGEASTADAAPERPAPDTLLGRILNALETSTRPRRPWQLQQELSLSRAPSAELSRLISQGHVVRLREGVYGAVGRTYDRPNA